MPLDLTKIHPHPKLTMIFVWVHPLKCYHQHLLENCPNSCCSQQKSVPYSHSGRKTEMVITYYTEQGWIYGGTPRHPPPYFCRNGGAPRARGRLIVCGCPGAIFLFKKCLCSPNENSWICPCWSHLVARIHALYWQGGGKEDKGLIMSTMYKNHYKKIDQTLCVKYQDVTEILNGSKLQPISAACPYTHHCSLHTVYAIILVVFDHPPPPPNFRWEKMFVRHLKIISIPKHPNFLVFLYFQVLTSSK